jgi:argininosuccinate lyase
MSTESFTSRLGKASAFPGTPFWQCEDPREPDHALQRDLDLHKAHVVMLVEQSIISLKDGQAILEELLDLERQGTSAFSVDPGLGLYLSTEQYLVKKLGSAVAGRLNTGRSRNDLGPAGNRMYIRSRINDMVLALLDLKACLLHKAEEHVDTIMPGYTHHSQHAQPITFAHYLMAGHDAFSRDVRRLEEAYEVVNLSPMGGAALATTGFPINRERVAELLGFAGLVENSLDATGQHDFILQTAAASVIALSNLGRLLEGIYLWNTAEFGMVELADEYCSISSIMPQKKNPVSIEMIRGEAVIAAHNLSAMMSVLKAVPPGGGREWSYTMRLFSPIANTFMGAMETFTGIISTLTVNKEVMARRAVEGFGTVTELADEIVRQTGLSFRDSHHIVGMTARMAIQSGKLANEITSEMIDVAAKEVIGKPLGLDAKIIENSLDAVENVRVRSIPGGPAPVEVRRMIEDRKGVLAHDRQRLEQRNSELEAGRIRLAQAVEAVLSH